MTDIRISTEGSSPIDPATMKFIKGLAWFIAGSAVLLFLYLYLGGDVLLQFVVAIALPVLAILVGFKLLGRGTMDMVASGAFINKVKAEVERLRNEPPVPEAA